MCIACICIADVCVLHSHCDVCVCSADACIVVVLQVIVFSSACIVFANACTYGICNAGARNCIGGVCVAH